MGFLSKLLSSGSGGVVDSVEGISNIVEKWLPGSEKKHEMAEEIQAAVTASVESARAMPLGGTTTWFDSFVNGINRLVRPVITIWLIGGLTEAWTLPSTGDIDPIVLSWIGSIIIFWFGGRALFKDLPSVIKYLKKR